MVRRIRRSTIFSLFAVVALLSLGIGYAAWADTLTLRGDVRTTNFDVAFGSNPQAQVVNPHGNGTCSPTTSNNGNVLTVDIDDAYPGFKCTVNVNIFNNGGVDAELKSTKRYQNGSLTGNNGQDDPYDAEFDYEPFGCESNTVKAGGKVACQFSVEVTEHANPNTTYRMSIVGEFGVPSNS